MYPVKYQILKAKVQLKVILGRKKHPLSLEATAAAHAVFLIFPS